MLGAAVDVQAGQRILGDDVAGQHAADGQLHGQLGLLLHQQAVLGLLEAADPAGVAAVVLLLQLLAGQNSLLGVDDHDEVAAVGVGGELRLVLAAQQGGRSGGSLAQGLARRIEDIPLADDVPLVGHKSGHGETSNFAFYDKKCLNRIRTPIWTTGAFCIIIRWFQGVNTFFENFNLEIRMLAQTREISQILLNAPFRFLIFEVPMNKILSYVRRCVEDYDMIQAGDRVAVGVSGGKDSLTLLVALARLREFYPKPFTVEAYTLDMGHVDGGEGMDFTGVEALCRELDVPFTLLHSEIHHIIFDLRKEKNPCSMCAKMRRGALHNALREHGITKIALGHHFDDAVETFFLSLFYEGRLSCFQPVTYLDRTGITQIRPLLYCGEGMLRNAAERNHLPVVFNPCPADGNTKRQEVKELIKSLDKQYPGLKSRVFGAMQGLPLPAWGPVEHRRVPLPDGR